MTILFVPAVCVILIANAGCLSSDDPKSEPQELMEEVLSTESRSNGDTSVSLADYQKKTNTIFVHLNEDAIKRFAVYLKDSTGNPLDGADYRHLLGLYPDELGWDGYSRPFIESVNSCPISGFTEITLHTNGYVGDIEWILAGKDSQLTDKLSLTYARTILHVCLD